MCAYMCMRVPVKVPHDSNKECQNSSQLCYGVEVMLFLGVIISVSKTFMKSIFNAYNMIVANSRFRDFTK